MAKFMDTFSYFNVLEKAIAHSNLSLHWPKSAVDSGKSFEVLLTDLSKSFDCLHQELLLAKLSVYGLRLSALSLICNYQFNKEQRTKINAS